MPIWGPQVVCYVQHELSYTSKAAPFARLVIWSRKMESGALASLAVAFGEERISTMQYAQCKDALDAVRAAAKACEAKIYDIKTAYG